MPSNVVTLLLTIFGQALLLTDKVSAQCPYPANASCPIGYAANEDTFKCFKAYSIPKTWLLASWYCGDRDTSLARIDNEKESTLVKGLLLRDKPYWIGLHDKYKEGTFEWTSDRTKRPTYTDWAPGQPDHRDSLDDCVYMSSSRRHKWADVSCYKNYYFVCGFRRACPPGYTFYEEGMSCFKTFTFSKSWSIARTICRNNGGDLARIDSRSEADFIKTLFEVGEKYWIGLNDRRNEKTFVWNSDGSASFVKYTDWADGQPNHRAREDCVFISKHSSRKWYDANCNLRLPYVCETEVASSRNNDVMFRSGTWQKGRYCMIRPKSTSGCPSGFTKSGFKWRTKDDAVTKIHRFCCRSDGSADTPIDLPTGVNILFVEKDEKCQQVRGMSIATRPCFSHPDWKLRRYHTQNQSPFHQFKTPYRVCQYWPL